jgi:hypothetical protein
MPRAVLGLAETKLAKAMLDAAFGELLRQGKYKSGWNGTYARATLGEAGMPRLSAWGVQPMCLSSAFWMVSLGTYPTICSFTWPPLNTNSVGIPRTP